MNNLFLVHVSYTVQLIAPRPSIPWIGLFPEGRVSSIDSGNSVDEVSAGSKYHLEHVATCVGL